MKLNEALELLEKENVTSSNQMLRRWIRQGKIKANLESKRQGYEVDAASLQSFIDGKKSSDIKPVGFKEGFNEGYAVAANEAAKHYKRLLLLGMYERQFLINRTEFREKCSNEFSNRDLDRFLDFSDQELFRKGVTKPRMKVYGNQIGEFIYFSNAHLMIDQRQYDLDQDISSVHLVYEMLIKELIEEFGTKVGFD